MSLNRSRPAVLLINRLGSLQCFRINGRPGQLYRSADGDRAVTPKMKGCQMNRAFSTIACTALICVSMSVLAQSSKDETQIRAITTGFEQAWNRHDMKALAAL